MNSRRSVVFWFIALVVGAGLVGLASAASLPGLEQRVAASDDDPSDWFGRSVDIYGDIAVVGAPGDDGLATNSGAAYVFRRQGDSWVEVQKLDAAGDAEQHDQFGFDVAVERDLIAVGARWDDDAGSDAGAVYLFEWDGMVWTRTEKFLPTDPSMSYSAYEYGTSVDIGIAVPAAGSVEVTDIVVGAPRADNFQGAVFLIERNGGLWTTIGKFSDSDVGGGNDAGTFGRSVAIHGDQIIGGAPPMI